MYEDFTCKMLSIPLVSITTTPIKFSHHIAKDLSAYQHQDIYFIRTFDEFIKKQFRRFFV